MSTRWCQDCGTKLTRTGVCQWCHEELYILEEQAEDVGPVSPEFQEKVDQQLRQVHRRSFIKE